MYLDTISFPFRAYKDTSPCHHICINAAGARKEQIKIGKHSCQLPIEEIPSILHIALLFLSYWPKFRYMAILNYMRVFEMKSLSWGV